MKEEISRILKMVEEGKIDSAKASELIEAIKSKDVETKSISTVLINDKRMLRIKVLSSDGDTVNVNVPIKFVKSVSGAISKLPGVAGVEGLDLEMIIEAIENGADGKIVDVTSSEGDIVEIVIE